MPVLPGGVTLGYSSVTEPIGRILGEEGLQAAFQNWSDQFSNFLQAQQQSYEDRSRANLVKAGISGDPTGQDILARGVGALTGTLLPQYTQQALGVAQFAVNLVNSIREAAREREARQILQNNELAVQERLARANAVEFPLELMERRLPLDTRAFRTAAELYRELFGGSATGGGGWPGFGSGLPSGFGSSSVGGGSADPFMDLWNQQHAINFPTAGVASGGVTSSPRTPTTGGAVPGFHEAVRGTPRTSLYEPAGPSPVGGYPTVRRRR